MEYNTCKTCGAKDGRAGLLVNDECLNCKETRKQGKLVLHSYLDRNNEEVMKTANILNAT